MIIGHAGIFVQDQSHARQFYTETLGFVLKHDIPLGNGDRWLTVVSPERPDGVELLLEPTSNPVATTIQNALFESGVPAQMFTVDNLDAEYERMAARGVEFTMQPTDAGSAKIADFNDTCGNLIRLMQMLG
ncbi:MAG: VOC family protein [Chloroflexi bacterium]|nr:VOC family protein [Chloroflexota bacterium]MCY4247275.1 VOC family protein [Chloroflexota bacterium]